MASSYRPMVRTGSDKDWVGNGLRFTTYEEAEQWVFDLSMRWIGVREVTVHESDDPPNYIFNEDGTMTHIEGTDL